MYCPRDCITHICFKTWPGKSRLARTAWKIWTHKLNVTNWFRAKQHFGSVTWLKINVIGLLGKISAKWHRFLQSSNNDGLLLTMFSIITRMSSLRTVYLLNLPPLRAYPFKSMEKFVKKNKPIIALYPCFREQVSEQMIFLTCDPVLHET